MPSLRGKERDRRPGEILREVQTLVEQGVVEVTLLGQTSTPTARSSVTGRRSPSCCVPAETSTVWSGCASPAASRDFTDDVIAAMAETPNVMPALHMPLQSGSDTVLKAMRRSYRQDRYLGIIERVRAAIPDAAITTDIIVGFPGETDDDLEQTLHVVREARFAGAFTFQYSKRPGTPAAEMAGQVPKAVVQERYDLLISTLEDITLAENRGQVGRTIEVLVAEGEGRKDAATARTSGRARDNRLVHLGTADGVRPGDLVEVEVTYGAPHHLVADGPVLSHRRTRGGDAWQARTDSRPTGVLLGMPSVGAPA